MDQFIPVEEEGFTPVEEDTGFTPAASVETRPVNIRAEEEKSMEKAARFKDIESRRWELNAREGFHSTEVGQRKFQNRIGKFEREQIKFYEKNRAKMQAAGVDVDALIAEKDRVAEEKWNTGRAERIKELEEYMELSNWYDEPKFLERLYKMGSSLSGNLIGGMASPENFAPVGKGANAFKTFLKGAAASAPIGFHQELATQLTDIEMGLRDKIDWEQVMVGTATSSGMSGALNAGAHHGLPSLEKNIGPSGEALSPLEVKAKAEADAFAAREAQRPKRTTPEDGNFPSIDKEFKVAETKDFVPVEEAYPEIDPSVRVDKPLDESQAAFMEESRTAPEGEFPKILDDTAPLEYPKIERGSGPEDVIFEPLEDAPYMPGRLAEQANVDEVPGSHELQFLPSEDAGPLGISGEPKNPFVDASRVDAANKAGLQGTDEMTFRTNLKKFMEGSQKQEEVYHQANLVEKGFYKFDPDRHGEFTFFSEDPNYGERVFVSKAPTDAFNLAVKNPLDLSDLSLAGQVQDRLKELGIDFKFDIDSAGRQGPAYTVFGRQAKLNKLKDQLKAKGYDSIKIQDSDQVSWLIFDGDQAFPKGRVEKPNNKKERNSALLPKKNITEQDIKLADALDGASTLHSAMDAVMLHGSEDGKALAKIVRGAGKDIPIIKTPLLPHEAGAVTTMPYSGKVEIEMDPRSHLMYGESVILHEAVHTRTNDALYAYVAGNGTPEQMKFGKEMEDLYKHVKKRIFDYAESYQEKWMQNLNEFNAYGITEPEFKEILKKIPYRGQSAWAKFLDTVQSFFGITASEKSVFNALMDSTDKWPAIQSTDRQRGASVARVQLTGGMRAPMTPSEGFKVAPALKDAWDKRVKARYGEFKTPTEMKNYLNAGGKIKDLNEYSGHITTQNQLAMMSDENPVVPFVFNYFFDVARKAETRMFGYDQMVKDSILWAEKNPEVAVGFFREWEKLNANPKSRELRSQLSENPEAFKAHFAKFGYGEDVIGIMQKFVDIMKDVHRADKNSLAIHGRELNDEPLYFPLGRAGPYHFVVNDETGATVYAGGYRTLGEARLAMQAIKSKAPDGYTFTDVVRTDPSRVINSAMHEALLGNSPPWLQEVAMKDFSRKLEYKRNFEQGRSGIEVGGYIGQIEPKTPKEMKEMLNKYLDAFSHRVRESHHLENATAAVEVSRDLLGPEGPLKDYPNTQSWANTMVSRHVGLDVSSWKPIDRLIQNAVEKTGKVMTRIDGVMKGYKPGENDNVVAANLGKMGVQLFSSMASLWKIGLSPQVLAGNLISNVNISMYGARDLAHMGKSPIYALAAQMDQLAYMATLGKDPRFDWVKKKMAQAKREGVIDPHGREDYSAVENVDRFHTAGEGTTSGLDWAANKFYSTVQKPRDWIEQATNWNAILYNHMMVKRAFPELSELEHDRLVYNLAKGFAGDYSNHAKMFMFQKMGTLGHLGSNFATWKFNRTSRYVDDAILAARVGEFGAAAFVPMFWSMAIGAVMAGAMGSVGLVEYEALRRLGTTTGLWDWKPLSAIINELDVVKGLDGHARTAVERGLVTTFSDMAAQQLLNENSGPDISGSIREASVLEAPLVAPTVAKDMMIAAGIGLKAMLGTDAMTKYVDEMPEGLAKDIAKLIQDKPSYGITSDEKKEAIKALPSVIQEWMRDQYVTKQITEDGKTKYVVPEPGENKGSYVRSEFQQKLARIGGLKTTDENRFNDSKQYHKQMERKAEKKYTALKEGIINNLDDTDLVERNAGIILKEHGEDALDRVIKDVEKIATEKMQVDYFTNKELAVARMRDGIAAERAMERLRKAKAIARP